MASKEFCVDNIKHYLVFFIVIQLQLYAFSPHPHYLFCKTDLSMTGNYFE